ncbi:hypothetical protein CFIO01_02490 [Colletotrichum fioriniae PJ7]|uniref:Uncharacterized protein n=1 Tax=Colletotrichum fioriniae PJ7 TaxID=1445577 RepID=A0A010QAG1_9PEZI|nr:hypothetical protein CFIO01_02490 [Colletotrichum fioriniae PJ7]
MATSLLLFSEVWPVAPFFGCSALLCSALLHHFGLLVCSPTPWSKKGRAASGNTAQQQAPPPPKIHLKEPQAAANGSIILHQSAPDTSYYFSLLHTNAAPNLNSTVGILPTVNQYLVRLTTPLDPNGPEELKKHSLVWTLLEIARALPCLAFPIQPLTRGRHSS